MMQRSAILAFLLLAAAEVGAQQLEKVADSIVDYKALCFTQGTWGICVNGQTFQQDALTSFQGFQYATYYDSARRVCLARKNDRTETWEVIRFADHPLKGNDSHNVAVIGVSAADGTIHLSFDHHVHPLHYRVSRLGVALRPEEFEWTADLFGGITNALEPGKSLTHVTYPRFLRSPGGGLQFGCRIGSSGSGDKCLADYDPVTRRWQDFGAYVGGKGRYEQSNSRNAYLNGLTYDRRGRLHVTWCWRETGDPMTNHDLDYAWSEDGGKTWFNNAGVRIGERGRGIITVKSPGVSVVEIGMNRGLINATTQAVDSRNRIHLVTFHLPDDLPQQVNWETSRSKAHYFHYWRDDDGRWQRNEINSIGSRPQLWFDDADNAYLVFVGDRYNKSPFLSIAAASARIRWKNWEVIYREKGPFTGQPQIDRYAKTGLLSIYIQEQPTEPGRTESPLRVMTYRAHN